MKKLSLCLAFLILITGLKNINAYAADEENIFNRISFFEEPWDFVYKDICYKITNEKKHKVSVISSIYKTFSESGKYKLPEKVYDEDTEYTVTGILNGAFNGRDDLKKITIPESVTQIEAESFNENCKIVFANGEQIKASKITGKPEFTLYSNKNRTELTLNISKTENAAGYYIYMKPVNAEEYELVKILKKDGSEERSYKISINEKDDYEFMVRTYAAIGNTMMDGPVSEVKHISMGIGSTVEKANSYDYTVTMNDSGQLLSKKEINELIKDYGTFGDTPGMPTEDYIAAMDFKWEDVTPEGKKWEKAEVDLSKKYSYKDLVSIMNKLATYEGVRLYKIGQSTSGKDMYALDVDLTDRAWEDSHIVLLTGQVHARETAGPVFILKELTDILNAYRNGTQKAKDALATTRFVAVACVNPDGHDGIGFDEKHWRYSEEVLWKATSDGTDINRNFPGLGWMQVKKGVEKTKLKSTSPNKIYYCGKYAGSSSEVKAMMKFYQYFIGVRKAEILVDYHMQGRIGYAGKGYAPEYNNSLSLTLFKACKKTQEKGSLGKSYTYDDEDMEKYYGLHGGGVTNTDYAWAVAIGTVFSTKYGFSVYLDEDGNEYPLVMAPSYKNAEPINSVGMRSPKFRSMSWEIGYGTEYLGYSDETRELIAQEFYDYNFDEMLYTYASEVKK